MRMFAGPNGSGKSSLNNVVASKWLGVYINADDIEKALHSTKGIKLADYKVSLTDEAFLAGYAEVCGKRKGDVNSARISCVGGVVAVDQNELNSYHAAMIAE